MPQKTWKIGEYAKGGIIRVELGSGCDERIVIRCIDYTSKDIIESSIHSAENINEIRWYLEDLTTPYYADKIIDWLTQKLNR